MTVWGDQFVFEEKQAAAGWLVPGCWPQGEVEQQIYMRETIRPESICFAILSTSSQRFESFQCLNYKTTCCFCVTDDEAAESLNKTDSIYKNMNKIQLFRPEQVLLMKIKPQQTHCSLSVNIIFNIRVFLPLCPTPFFLFLFVRSLLFSSCHVKLCWRRTWKAGLNSLSVVHKRKKITPYESSVFMNLNLLRARRQERSNHLMWTHYTRRLYFRNSWLFQISWQNVLKCGEAASRCETVVQWHDASTALIWTCDLTSSFRKNVDFIQHFYIFLHL